MDDRHLSMAGDSATDTGSGGMQTKLQAARIATHAGCSTVIASGRALHSLKLLFDGGGEGLKGRGIGVLTNMVSYIKELETMDLNEAKVMLAELEAAVATGEFLFVLPQFLVSARKAETGA